MCARRFPFWCDEISGGLCGCALGCIFLALFPLNAASDRLPSSTFFDFDFFSRFTHSTPFNAFVSENVQYCLQVGPGRCWHLRLMILIIFFTNICSVSLGLKPLRASGRSCVRWSRPGAAGGSAPFAPESGDLHIQPRLTPLRPGLLDKALLPPGRAKA